MLFGVERNFFWASLVPARDGVHYMEWDRESRSLAVSFYSLKDRSAKPLMKIRRADMDRDAAFDVSPDRKYVVYSKVDQTETNLASIEGFR
jgi:hypothetical protein